jgi:hypothetical protein
MLYLLKVPCIGVFSTNILTLLSNCVDLILAGTAMNIKIIEL